MDYLVRIKLLESVKGLSNDTFAIVTAYADKRPIKAETISKGVFEMKEATDLAKEFARELNINSYFLFDKEFIITDEKEA